MNLKLQFVCICLSHQFTQNLNTVISTPLQENKNCTLNNGVQLKNVFKLRAKNWRRQGLMQKMFFNMGPKRTHKYNPNIGYEPYWPGGEWVYTTDTEKTTTGISGEMCGIECPRMFKMYGTVCGRNKKLQYKTFENYCDMMTEDCSSRSGWLIAYRGACINDFTWLTNNSAKIVTNAEVYISNFFAEQFTPTVLFDIGSLKKRPSTTNTP